MITETEFTELGNSLSTGFFIDRVVMTLVRIQRLGKVTEESRPVLQEALQLLNQICEGEKWLDNKTFDSRSAESAMAFNRAVSSLSFQFRAQKEFTDYIEKLKTIIESLLEQNRISEEEDLRTVRNFFSAYGRRVFIEAQNIIDRSGEPPGFRLWNREQRDIT